jgi:putative ABC transport system ATP-binding protein
MQTATKTTAVKASEAIQVRGLCHWFGIGEARKQVLFDIDLTIARGEFIVLVGASGSGKTTLLTLLGCLRHVQHGEINLLGTPLAKSSPERLVLQRRRLGFVFQAHNLHDSLTALQNVEMGLAVHDSVGAAQSAAAAEHLLGLLGLSHRLHHLPAQLSGGQKQRVAIARALVGNPEIVLADEPTAALDRESAHQVVTLLKRLAQQRATTTILVTHDARIMGMADRILTMEDGRLLPSRME